MLACAQTGTGKTAAFALPILNRLGKQNRKAQPGQPLALVLAPTRELAIQIGSSFATYGKHLHLRCTVVYGGVGQASQVRGMRRGTHILIATPGRLLDLMNQGYIDLARLKIFVLDEADRMLDMGFMPDLKRIIQKLPDQRQSLFFSATLPPKITELSQSLLSDPVHVRLTPKTVSVKSIEQRVLFVDRSGKKSLLRKVLSEQQVDSAIVFTRTKRGADALAKELVRNGIKSTAIHGNKSQNARQHALDLFRRGRTRILVATDVVARGIDVDGISHVINFDLPDEPESYVHRIGRTGRAGASGIALSLCTGDERRELRAIEKFIGMKIQVDPEHGQLDWSASETEGQRPARKLRRRQGGKPRRKTSKAAPTGRSGPHVGENEGKSIQKRRSRRSGPKRSPRVQQSVD